MFYKIGQYVINSKFYYNYEFSFELFKTTSQDRYEILKNPTSLFTEDNYLNDPIKYLINLKNKFRIKSNLASSNILESKDFNLEINDQLFKQYYLQNLKNLNTKPSSNFEISNYNLYALFLARSQQYPDFAFSINLASKHIEITNEENLTKLVLNLLNSLSIWFNICLLKFLPFFNKFYRIIFIFYKFLIKSKNNLFINF